VFGEEAANTNFIVVGSTRPGLEPTIYCTWPLHHRCGLHVDDGLAYGV